MAAACRRTYGEASEVPMVYIDAAERRQQFVRAAVVAMERDGVWRTTMRSVAAEAGVPLGTLQYVFPSKKELFTGVIEAVISGIDALPGAPIPAGGLAQALRVRATAVWEEWVAPRRDSQLVQLEFLSYSLRTPGMGRLARRQLELFVTAVVDWLEKASAQSGETFTVSFDEVARLLLAGIDGLMIQLLVHGDADRSRGDLAVLLDMVIARAGVRPLM
ncbi:TetR/AcrR family transcriptional regulator [Nocardioides KLBMP 9356]|uniref:TetR/AcrR family transcriptional regulator n=1 Tax=Nocardioides potassii TaxID=2911371 RepID=A0ABS9HGF5_9ACTN|nr:TetR/AcrR family transcriptional regulator [Nocardioides potassii]MCF6379295.1 TetR/AcrR family transcriptional regulator [Nocardioides potassii]